MSLSNKVIDALLSALGSSEARNELVTAVNSAGVPSINGISGGITLAAGSNITISPSGNTITISASGGGGGGVTSFNGLTGAVTGAKTDLSNLTSTAINIDLVPNPPNTFNLGSSSSPYLYIYGNQLRDSSNTVVMHIAARQLRDPSNNTMLIWSGTNPDLNTHKLVNVVDPTNPQDAATKNYVDTHAGGSGATTALDNLASTAVNDNILPDSNGTRNLGSGALRWSLIAGNTIQAYSQFLMSDLSNVSQIRLQGVLTLPSGDSAASISTDAFDTSVASDSISLYTNTESTSDAQQTGNVYIQTGNKSAGTGNSGDIKLQTGTSAGGTRGSVYVNGTKLKSTVLLTTAATVGGAATEAVAVTGLLTTDTIISVSQKTKGGANLPLLGWSTQIAGGISVIYSADMGSGAVSLVAVLR